MRLLLLLAIAIPLAGCVQSRGHVASMAAPAAPPGGVGITADGELAEGPGAVSSVSELPAFAKRGAIAPYGAQGEAAAYEFGTGYRVGSGDKLTVRVLGETDLTGDYPVDGSGQISMPYVQSVTVAGMTAAQIEKLIAKRLREGFLRDPQVSVQVTEFRPFYIMGEIANGGSFAYRPGMTVQNAVAIAGGFSGAANRNLVQITRKNSRGTATYEVPLTTQIYPGDIVTVL